VSKLELRVVFESSIDLFGFCVWDMSEFGFGVGLKTEIFLEFLKKVLLHSQFCFFKEAKAS
jgi:hypothetical protein